MIFADIALVKKGKRLFMNKLREKTMGFKNKNEVGSITLFVLIVILFFIIVLMEVYAGLKTKKTSQSKETDKIQAEYNVSGEDVERVYEEEIKIIY